MSNQPSDSAQNATPSTNESAPPAEALSVNDSSVSDSSDRNPPESSPSQQQDDAILSETPKHGATEPDAGSLQEASATQVAMTEVDSSSGDNVPTSTESSLPAETTTSAASSAPDGSTSTTSNGADAPVAQDDASQPAAATESTDKKSAESNSADAGDTDTGDASQPARRIAIGSQRDSADKSLAPAQPKAVREAAEETLPIKPAAVVESDLPADAVPESVTLVPKAPVAEKVPVPSKRQSNADLEQELEATLGSVSMDDVISKSQDDIVEQIEIDGRYKGTVTRIHKDDVFFTLKGRFEGVASARQFKKPPEVGTMTDVIVKGFNQEDGIYEVAIPGASISVEDWSDIDVGSTVEVRVTGSNTGGLECQINNIRGFIPASQIELHRVENLSDYINKKLTCVVTEAKPKRKNLVLSHRKVLEKEMEEIRKESLSKLEAGKIVEGKVTRLREFGAFIDIGGIEGLAHISKLSWERIDKPDDVLQVGQQVKVKIEKVNLENGKISLSYRDTIAHPWEGIETKYAVDSTVKGTVTRLAQFGAFVKLEPGVEGLVHISELAHYRVVAVKNVVNEGDEVEVKILSVDRDAQKIGLSMKATQPAPEKKEEAKPAEVEADDPHRELAVPKRRKKLKGGMDRRSGGDNFGLKW